LPHLYILIYVYTCISYRLVWICRRQQKRPPRSAYHIFGRVTNLASGSWRRSPSSLSQNFPHAVSGAGKFKIPSDNPLGSVSYFNQTMLPGGSSTQQQPYTQLQAQRDSVVSASVDNRMGVTTSLADVLVSRLSPVPLEEPQGRPVSPDGTLSRPLPSVDHCPQSTPALSRSLPSVSGKFL